MTLKEKNNVLRLALDNINYIVTENAGNNPTDIEKQYDCNAFAFDAICKVVADCVRAGLPGNDLPPKLRAKCRSNCERFALSAMKHYLKRGHRKTYRTIAKKEGK